MTDSPETTETDLSVLPQHRGRRLLARTQTKKVFLAGRVPRAPVPRGLAACHNLRDIPLELERLESGPRHFCYYLYPIDGPVWRWNLDQLYRRLELFDGKRMFVIALDSRTAPVTEIVEALADFEADLRFVDNNPQWRESRPIIERLEEFLFSEEQPEGFVFFAHAKGTTRQKDVKLSGVLAWAEYLYRANLDNWPRAAAALTEHAAAGACFNSSRIFGTPFFFCGSFYWLRTDALRKRFFVPPEYTSHIIEFWTSLMFPPDNVAPLGPEGPWVEGDPYLIKLWEKFRETGETRFPTQKELRHG